MKTDEVRERFLEYFKEKGHRAVASDSLVPANDPSLLFTGAGMNQFKEYFLGRGKMDYTRATSCQKCLRTGDIENVGRTAAHHTFFEMLGNFSFGDYFKRETIHWAWEFLGAQMKVPAEKLSVSVYKDDEEAYGIWAQEIRIPAKKIYRFGAKDNFWPSNAPSDGPNGPCGPCSEIFYDMGANTGCGRPECDPSCSCGRHFEIWNLVFTQFDRQDGGKLDPLPQKNIDTGMGLERIARVMQGKQTNFDIDIFVPIVGAIGSLTGTKYGRRKESDQRIKRIADHTRAAVFVIADGVLPSNEGRGYVLRRLLRRAVSDGITLGAEDAFLYDLVPVVCEAMGKAYPEVAAKRENIAVLLKSEEERFRETLEAGGQMIDKLFAEMRKENRRAVTGQEAFRLHDTYGYPVEFLMERAAEAGYEVDAGGFENEMEAQRERARSGSNIAADIFAGARNPIHDLAARARATEFRGYDQARVETKVIGILKGEALVDRAGHEDEEVGIVLEATPFYAESGGQVGDAGRIRGQGFVFEVKDTQRSEGFFLHIGKVKEGAVKAGADAVAEIDADRRLAIMRNHTATHLLQYALRKLLGTHVEQSGSLVAAERLRFDFTHFQALRREEIRDVERIVNEAIAENAQVSTYETSLAEARSQGVMALFGEKYGAEVRVVKVGGISAELCGGTHLDRAGSVGFFKVISEESVAQGVRRIIAVTSARAVEAVHKAEAAIEEAAEALDAPASRLVERAREVAAEARGLRKSIEKQAASKASSAAQDLVASAKALKSMRIIVKRLDGLTLDELRLRIDGLKGEKGLATVLGSVKDDKVALIAAASADLTARGISAVNIVKQVASEISGGGGGRPEMAQAGGKNPAGLDKALEKAEKLLEKADEGGGA
jgi:alanyl-tRNA synthetase